MQFEIETPSLKKAMGAFDHVIDKSKSDQIQPNTARNMVNAGRGIVAAVGTELRVRLAQPKLARE